MSLTFYDNNEGIEIEESINNYKDLFLEIAKNPPTLKESLLQLFSSSGLTNDKVEEFSENIIFKSKKKVEENLSKINEKYPKIQFDEAVIISSYTCEAEDRSFSPYNILNKNMISQKRKEGLKNVSKYLFILLKTLRLLPRYYPDPTQKYLYRCINAKVNLMIDPDNEKLVPYIRGKNKTFWTFTSTSPKIKTSFEFLGEEKSSKYGTIFSLEGKIWGYDITLFNYFDEEEILLEPERKYFIEHHIPEVNGIINVVCQIKETPIVLDDIIKIPDNIMNINDKNVIKGNDKKEKEINIKENIIEDINKIHNEKNLTKEIDKKEEEIEIKENIIEDINEITIKYKINKEENRIKLFGDEFIKNNKRNCKIFISGVEVKICTYYDKYNKNHDILEIKLKGIKNITNMSHMFDYCKSLLSLPDISKWNTNKVTDMSYIFSNCRSLSSLPDISKWNTSKVTNMNGMFNFCNLLNSLPDISKWNTSKVTGMGSIFSFCFLLKSLPDISKWITSNVKDMSSMFSECRSLTSLPDISKWNTSKVTDMKYMFCHCSLLSLPDISNWNTSNVTDMKYMFYLCSNLGSLPDISKWNINKVETMESIFCDCRRLKSLPDISIWNTRNIKYMNDMFENCESLTSLPDISKWDTRNVLFMSYMFYGCSSLTSLPDISKWKTNNLKGTDNMFGNCLKLPSMPEIETKKDCNII